MSIRTEVFTERENRLSFLIDSNYKHSRRAIFPFIKPRQFAVTPPSTYLRNLSSPSIRLSSILLPRPILSFPLPLPVRLKSRSVRRTNHEVYIANSPERCATGTGRKRAAFSKRSNVYTRSRVYTSIEASLLLAASPYPGVNEQRRCARRHTLGERGDHGSFSRSDRERQGWRRRRRKKIPLPCNDASAATVVRGGSIPIVGPCRKGRRGVGYRVGIRAATVERRSEEQYSGGTSRREWE